jgi:hypothetical protein
MMSAVSRRNEFAQVPGPENFGLDAKYAKSVAAKTPPMICSVGLRKLSWRTFLSISSSSGRVPKAPYCCATFWVSCAS